ncbi:uncharacterized protein FOMMEDRAFT_164356 [Fomitiporia mediterranea MF3/22]|uniref:uncharacterized protein n=1 Tax=Fomitiporia mediterranea (strain MF3/22) TaxID=694068 RepID=UPI00044078F3|nr:uncharacterized protein FOMMEDRAFT_164356 [Fomitiporia mediterranea MF3/22]EJD07369.1 hypothetical protein FOMMEDRAFT_164356 [Fomitiporia mediterranea MF3/22]
MSFRAPKERYAGQNGFDDFNKRLPTESLKESEAVDAQDAARFVIREMGSFFPSFEDMKKDIQTPETVESTKERIKRLKRENQDNMAKLSRYYAQELYDDSMDRYLQTDDIKYFDFEDFSKSSDEWAQHYARLENFFKQDSQIVASEHLDIVSRMHYDHLRELLPLYRRRRDLEKQAELTRIRLAAQFPQTIEDYQRMDSKGAQLRVAKFLMAEDPKREEMRTESRWAWRQTEPLIQLYKNNETFQREIERFVSENESRDPRARRV